MAGRQAAKSPKSNLGFSFQDLVSELKSGITEIDPITWVENNLYLEGKPVQIRGTGRDYLTEVYNYLVFGLFRPDAVPFLMLKSRKVEMSTTATFAALYMMTSGLYDNITALQTFPTLGQSRRYSTSYFDIIAKSATKGRLYEEKRDKTGIWSVSHKQFVKNCQLFIEGSSEEGDRLRNMILDITWFDEIQDIFPRARNNVREAMGGSRFGPPGTGVEGNFGTPKEAGSNFDGMWKDSDQRHYHLRCLKCHGLFLIVEENFIHGYMVECTHCNHLQDKRKAMVNGEWIALRTKGNIDYRGYFLNQLYSPKYTAEAIQRKKRQYARQPQTYENEVLGHFWAGSVHSLTLEDVYRGTVETHGPRATQRAFKEFILPTDRFTFMGIDWGGKEDPSDKTGSDTVITIVSLEPDNKIMLEHTERLTANEKDLDQLLPHIDDLWQRFSVDNCVADLGFGHTEIRELQKKYFEKVKSCYFSANAKKTYSYNSKDYMLTVNRDHVIEEVTELIRSARFIFPFKDPSQTDWAMQHCTSMTVESRFVGGSVRKTFKKGGSPNDFLMSLVYAYLAYMFTTTRGFALNTLAYAEGRRVMPVPKLAHVSRGRGLMIPRNSK